MSYTKEQILEHYRSEAQNYGQDGTSTIVDIRTRQLEINALFNFLSDGQTVLEVGCGNGYVALQAIEQFDIDLTAVDFSEDMISLAKQRDTAGRKGRVTYSQLDILELSDKARYDLVFTERCLQNLTSWEEQKKALANIAESIKPGGRFVMLESFWSGHRQMNLARAELDLPEVKPPWHNLFFDEEQTKDFMASQNCRYSHQDRFLSGYYFGSRVLLPALMPKGKKVESKSVLNDYFCSLPPSGDFCPMKIVVFVKDS